MNHYSNLTIEQRQHILYYKICSLPFYPNGITYYHVVLSVRLICKNKSSDLTYQFRIMYACCRSLGQRPFFSYTYNDAEFSRKLYRFACSVDCRSLTMG